MAAVYRRRCGLHYHRLFGLGSGMEPSPHHAHVVTAYRDLVIRHRRGPIQPSSLNGPKPYLEFMRETLQAPTNATCIEARESVEKKWGDLRVGITPSAPGRLS